VVCDFEQVGERRQAQAGRALETLLVVVMHVLWEDGEAGVRCAQERTLGREGEVCVTCVGREATEGPVGGWEDACLGGWVGGWVDGWVVEWMGFGSAGLGQTGVCSTCAIGPLRSILQHSWKEDSGLPHR
jgi:hypothetical protein